MDESTSNFLAQESANAAEVLGIPNETPDEVTETPAEPVQAIEPEPATQTVEEVVQPTETIEVEEDDEDNIPTFYNPYQTQESPQVQEYQQTQQPQTQQQAPQLPTLDPTQFTDEYGNVDMAKFSQAMANRDQALVAQVASTLQADSQQTTRQVLEQAAQISTQKVMEARAEERAWERTFEKYPQVKANKDLRDQVHKMRLGEVASTGKNVSPVKVADRLFKVIASAREEGVKQATQTVTIQSSAHLETSNNTASEKGLKAQKDWTNIGSRDRRESDSARTALLKQMLADGQI
jgi:hypothetical protein